MIRKQKDNDKDNDKYIKRTTSNDNPREVVELIFGCFQLVCVLTQIFGCAEYNLCVSDISDIQTFGISPTDTCKGVRVGNVKI